VKASLYAGIFVFGLIFFCGIAILGTYWDSRFLKHTDVIVDVHEEHEVVVYHQPIQTLGMTLLVLWTIFFVSFGIGFCIYYYMEKC